MENIISEYHGEVTQAIVGSMAEAIENNIENMGLMGKTTTVAIEMTQNIMNYSKSESGSSVNSEGSLFVLKAEDDKYIIETKNIVSVKDKEYIEPILKDISSMDSSGIKKRYKELRKSGANSHEKGGGIGFYEIAKNSTSMEHSFELLNDKTYTFNLKATVESRKKKD